MNDTHNGTVHVESGLFTINGILRGTLNIRQGAATVVNGSQEGPVRLSDGVKATINGSVHGPVLVERHATLIIEAGGILAGPLNNYGSVILRGVFGGPQTGDGEFIVEDQGYIKKPVIRDGKSYYEL